jgi:hypothetical protein
MMLSELMTEKAIFPIDNAQGLPLTEEHQHHFNSSNQQ